MSIPTRNFYFPGSDPDVYIRALDRAFILHSQVLKFCSAWFAASMSQKWWKTEYSTSHYKYCYLLDWDEDGISTLLPSQAKDATHDDPINDTPESHPQAIHTLYTTYETMFKAFYRQPIPEMNLRACTAVVSLADQYEALHSIHDSICARLFEWDELEDQIENKPLQFLLLGYKLQSCRVFNEAFIHVIGTQCGELDSPAFSSWCSDSNVPESVLHLIKSECNKLNKLLLDAMRKFLRIHPGRDVDSLAGSELLRLSFSRCFSNYGAVGNEGLLFRLIASGLKPLDSDVRSLSNKSKIEQGSLLIAYNEIILPIKLVALALSKNNLRSKKPMSYLTCVGPLKDTEFPWQQ